MTNSGNLPSIGKVILGSVFNLTAVLLGMNLPAWSQTPSLEQLVNQWGYTRVACVTGAVFIRSGSATICVNSTPQLPAGDYTYDLVTNQLVAVGSQSTRENLNFSFTRLADYTNCVDDILTLYKDKEQFRQQPRRGNCLAEVLQAYTETGISKQQALELLKAANEYVSTALTVRFYPLRGQREQIATFFGFIYDLDVNDPEIQRMAASGSP